MDFGGLLVLGVVWLLFSLLGSRKGHPREERRVRPPGPAARPAGAADPTQQEGSRLEQLLRQLERNLEEVGGTQPAPSARPSALPSRVPATGLPSAEEVENRESFDDEPVRVVSLEGEVHRPQRRRVVQDDAAEELVRRRIDAARSRDRALTKADHAAFDARIRREPADHTAVRRFTPAQLRDAVVWREILGPPVSERER